MTKVQRKFNKLKFMFVRETLHVIIITFAYRCRMFHTKSSYNLKHKYYCRKLSFNELRSIKAPSSELILMNNASLSETRLAPSSGINERALDTSDTNWGPIGVPKQRWFLFSPFRQEEEPNILEIRVRVREITVLTAKQCCSRLYRFSMTFPTIFGLKENTFLESFLLLQCSCFCDQLICILISRVDLFAFGRGEAYE